MERFVDGAREAAKAAAIGLTLSGVAPCLAVWALWSLLGEALLDAVFVALRRGVRGCGRGVDEVPGARGR